MNKYTLFDSNQVASDVTVYYMYSSLLDVAIIISIRSLDRDKFFRECCLRFSCHFRLSAQSCFPLHFYIVCCALADVVAIRHTAGLDRHEF